MVSGVFTVAQGGADRPTFSLAFLRALTVHYSFNNLSTHYLRNVLTDVRHKVLRLIVAAFTLTFVFAAIILSLENLGDTEWLLPVTRMEEDWNLFSSFYFIMVRGRRAAVPLACPPLHPRSFNLCPCPLVHVLRVNAGHHLYCGLRRHVGTNGSGPRCRHVHDHHWRAAVRDADSRPSGPHPERKRRYWQVCSAATPTERERATRWGSLRAKRR